MTGKGMTAATQPTQEVGNMPINMAMTADGKYIVTTDIGHYESLYAIRTSDGKAVSHVEFDNHTTTLGGEANTPTAQAHQ